MKGKGYSIHRCFGISAIIVFSLLTAFSSSAQASSITPPAPNSIMEGRSRECQTKHVVFNPHGPHEYYWAWVANFEINGQDQTTSCVMLFKSGEVKPIGSVQVMCVAEPAGSVEFKDGKAMFHGGHLACNVDLSKLLPKIETGLIVDQFYDYNDILIAAAGNVNFEQKSASNPVLVYQATQNKVADFGVYLPTFRNTTNLKWATNGVFMNTLKTIPLSSASKDTKVWMIHYTPQGESQAQVNLSMGKQRLTFSKPVQPMRFHMGGGTFYIGGTPNGAYFTGMLDEVVVDPYDGGHPPNSKKPTGP